MVASGRIPMRPYKVQVWFDRFIAFTQYSALSLGRRW